MEEIVQLVLACCTTVHFVLACVMSIYARHKIQYLCLAWVNGLFFAMFLMTAFFSARIAVGQPGVLHPMMLVSLVVACFLQSIYPLSIPMPAYLQWGRMWRYAAPAIILIVIYIPIFLFVDELLIVPSVGDLFSNFFRTDLILRFAAFGLCVYYIINIFRLPHSLARSADVPRYLFGYCTALGLIVIYYMFVSVYYDPIRLMVYVVLFSVANMYLTFRVLETMAVNLPKPVIEAVEAEPTEEEVKKAEREDFNEANVQRFQRIQYWMQNHKEEWTDNTFGRDRLCEAVGYNRHLVLQSVRSQGFNNVHDYINSYRISELKYLVESGKATTVNECLAAGFGTAKTVRSCFQKMEDASLDDFLEYNKIRRNSVERMGCCQ